MRLPRAKASDPTSSATVVRAEAYAGEAKAVAELVATAPGVAVREQGPGQLATVSIRGASADGVRVLLDGMPLNTAAGGGVDLSRIPRGWVSSMEIVRGAEGARFGAGALGGVVNVVTRAAGGDAWSTELGVGSFRTWTAGADVSTGGNGWGLAAALSLSGTRGDFPFTYDRRPSTPGGEETVIRRPDASGSGGLLAKAFLRRGDARWDVLLQASGGEREIPGNPLTASDPLIDLQRDGRVALAVRHARPGPAGALLAATLALRGDGLDLHAGSTLFRSTQRGQAASLELKATGELGPASLEAGATAGGERLAGTGLGDARTRAELAAWAAGEVTAAGGRVRLAPALRAEAAGPFHGLSAKLGTSVALGGPLALRASAGRTFRAPSFSELHLTQAALRPNPDLTPERALSADAGLVAEGRLALASVTAFVSRYEDLIVYVPLSLDTFGPVNDARALVRGLEAEAAVAPVGPLGLSAQGAATLLASRTLRGKPEEVGHDLPRKPRVRLFGRVGGERGAFEAHAEVQHLGRQWKDAEARTSIGASTTANVGLSARLARRPELRLHLEVRNVADAQDVQDGFANPLPGRTVMITLRAGGTTR
ncbi:MAG: TonB-dependent receptor [Anaeromyxobacteraceae bacterium]